MKLVLQPYISTLWNADGRKVTTTSDKCRSEHNQRQITMTGYVRLFFGCNSELLYFIIRGVCDASAPASRGAPVYHRAVGRP